METGVSYNKQRVHRMGYFAELMSTNEEVSESIRPLLRLCREQIDRSIRMDTALLRSLDSECSPAQQANATHFEPAHLSQPAELFEAARLGHGSNELATARSHDDAIATGRGGIWLDLTYEQYSSVKKDDSQTQSDRSLVDPSKRPSNSPPR